MSGKLDGGWVISGMSHVYGMGWHRGIMAGMGEDEGRMQAPMPLYRSFTMKGEDLEECSNEKSELRI